MSLRRNRSLSLLVRTVPSPCLLRIEDLLGSAVAGSSSFCQVVRLADHHPAKGRGKPRYPEPTESPPPFGVLCPRMGFHGCRSWMARRH
jgi:hypothetical protein